VHCGRVSERTAQNKLDTIATRPGRAVSRQQLNQTELSQALATI